MSEARHWVMRLGPARVALSTVLPVQDAVAAMRRRGETVLFDLVPTRDTSPRGARVQHVIAARERAAAVWDGSTLTVYAGASELAVESLVYLAYLVLETELHRHGLVTLHAAAVCRDGAAVLLLGPAGAGKTTTAIRLCRDHGAVLAGNDLVVAGGTAQVPEVVAGSHHLRLRHASVTRAMPELLSLFPGDAADPWRAKRNVEPGRIGIATAAGPAVVAAVVFIHIDPGYSTVVDEPGDTLVHRLNLHENAVRYIRGGSTPWLLPSGRFGPYVPPLDSEAAHAARTASLERLLARARYVAGPPAAAAAHLSELLATGAPALVDADPGGMP